MKHTVVEKAIMITHLVALVKQKKVRVVLVIIIAIETIIKK